MKVLIVDDDAMNRQCLQRLIAWADIGCESPITAADGAEALALIEKHRPDIVITDIKMPVMDGKELCRKIYENYPDISIYFVSAYGDFETAQLAIRCNVKGYVLKPLDRAVLDSLQEMVTETVSKKEYGSFCQKIIAGDYQVVLQTAIEEKDTEVFENLFERLSKIPEHYIGNDTSLWQRLLSPVTFFKATHLKMEYSLVAQAEQNLLAELIPMSVPERVAMICEMYRELVKAPSQNNDVVWEVQEAVKNEFSSPDLDIGVLAQRFDLSSAYLGKILLEQIGVRLSDYITDRRIEFACEELRNGRKSIKEVSTLAGYRDPGYFNKVFRKKMGITPKGYRENFKSMKE